MSDAIALLWGFVKNPNGALRVLSSNGTEDKALRCGMAWSEHTRPLRATQLGERFEQRSIVIEQLQKREASERSRRHVPTIRCFRQMAKRIFVKPMRVELGGAMVISLAFISSCNAFPHSKLGIAKKSLLCRIGVVKGT
jgi:hypothetical protein